MMKFKIEGYFTLQERLLKLSGLSLNENQSLLYKIYSWSVCLLIIVLLCLIIHDITLNFDNIDIVIGSVYHCIGIIVTLCKYWTFTQNRNKLNKILNLLQQGVFAPNKDRGGAVEEIWIAECIKNSNILMMTGYILSLATLFIRVAATLLKRITNINHEQWELPFAILESFHPTHSPNFELALLFQSSILVVGSGIYVVSDFFVVTVFAHVCTQFKILRNSINRIIIERFNGMETKLCSTSAISVEELRPVQTRWEYLQPKLRDIVLYHRAIMDLAQQLEDILNAFVLTNYTGAMIAMAFIMYHGSLYPLSDNRFQRDITVGILVLFQVFLISYFGNEVTIESQLVLPDCFQPKFFDADIRLQKGLSIIMARCQRPTKFTIGKFADLTMISFVAFVRASFSYFMVLHNMNQADEMV